MRPEGPGAICNPRVALLLHWPEMERQVHVTGEAAVAERELAEELFAERDLVNQLQTVVSRQGEEIEDWGALRVRPEAIEFLHESPDRLHERRLFTRDATGWATKLLAP